jgi:hypothetical protein
MEINRGFIPESMSQPKPEQVSSENLVKLISDYSYAYHFYLLLKSDIKNSKLRSAVGNIVGFANHPDSFLIGRISGLQSSLILLGQKDAIEKIHEEAPKDINDNKYRDELYKNTSVRKLNEMFKGVPSDRI